MVEFQPDHNPPSLGDILALKEDLAAKLARLVDLVMEAAIRNPYVRRDIERTKESVYAA
ncbi:hypothetical protein [Inquilinus sp. CAU 1745]|uniref:hypothetical protein n=1 Tax=Inquilinus sp. CAU 1745 TaxID=3140369 RepID=UPI00325B5E5D